MSEQPAKSKQDWLPSWTTKSKYPDPKTATLERWAWEFLRRNPEYQKDWDFVSSLPPFEEYFCNPDFKPTKEPGKVMAGWYREIPREWASKVEIVKPLFFMSRAYGLGCEPCSPATPYNDKRLYFLPAAPNITCGTVVAPEGGLPLDGFESLPSRLEMELDKDQIAVIYDLSKPLSYQLERAEKTIKWERARRKNPKVKDPRPQYSKFVDYLRILDAMLMEVEVGVIADELFFADSAITKKQANQRVTTGYEAAKEYRDYKYRFLV